MTYNKLLLSFFIVIIALAAFTALYFTVFNVSNHEGQAASTHAATTNININNDNVSTNTTITEGELKKIIEEAKDIYLDALEKNDTSYISIDNFSKMLIMNATIINGTTLSVNHTVYRYVVVHIYDAESNLSFAPERTSVDGIVVQSLPMNKSITYTGGTIYNYLVTYEGKTYKVSFSSVGFFESSFYLTAFVQKIGDNMYQVQITVNRELGNTAQVSSVWFILVGNS